MRLSDIMGNANLAFYPVVGLVLFLFAFALIVVYVFSKRNQAAFERASQLPLGDEELAVGAGPKQLKQRGAL